jgi:hypothetical protein
MATVSSWWRRLPLQQSSSSPSPKAGFSLVDELIASEQELGFSEPDEQASAAPLLGRQQALARRPRNALPTPRRIGDFADLPPPPSSTPPPSSSTQSRTKTKTTNRQLDGSNTYPPTSFWLGARGRALPLSHYESSAPQPSPPQLERIDFASSTTRLLYRTSGNIIEAICIVPRFVLIYSLTLKFWIHVGILVGLCLVVTRK